MTNPLAVLVALLRQYDGACLSGVDEAMDETRSAFTFAAANFIREHGPALLAQGAAGDAETIAILEARLCAALWLIPAETLCGDLGNAAEDFRARLAAPPPAALSGAELEALERCEADSKKNYMSFRGDVATLCATVRRLAPVGVK